MIRGWKTTLGTLKFSNTHVYAQIHNLLLCTNLVCAYKNAKKSRKLERAIDPIDPGYTHVAVGDGYTP